MPTNDAIAQQSGESGPRKWVFDKTINIPTLITIGAMLTGAVTMWNEQTRRIDQVERTANGAANDVKRVEAVQQSQEKNQSAQLQTLRNEFRSDLRDISGKLDTLIMNQAGFRPDTKGWTK